MVTSPSDYNPADLSRRRRGARLGLVDALAVATFTEHGCSIAALAGSPDGKTAATAGADGQIRIWESPLREEK